MARHGGCLNFDLVSPFFSTQVRFGFCNYRVIDEYHTSGHVEVVIFDAGGGQAISRRAFTTTASGPSYFASGRLGSENLGLRRSSFLPDGSPISAATV